jgi:ketosteroid isomerase-like protein
LDLDAFHPDIDWHTRDDLPDSGTYRGHDGVARRFSEWAEAFANLRVHPEELIDAGD